MSVLNWMWRVILLVTAGCFVVTMYYMTHNVDMELVLPTMNVVTIAGAALLGVIWTATRRYWYVLIMLVCMGLLRGLFENELLTEFQSVWVFISGGFVIFILLVTLIAQVAKEDRAKRIAAATAQSASQLAAAPPAPADLPAPTLMQFAATQPAPTSPAESTEERPPVPPVAPPGAESTADMSKTAAVEPVEPKEAEPAPAKTRAKKKSAKD